MDEAELDQRITEFKARIARREERETHEREEQEKRQAERDRLAYLRRTGRREMKP